MTQKDQVVTGETAVFDTKANLITMLGGVVLTQCKNVLRGDRLTVDMTTGVSRVESDNGRVQGLFNQGAGLRAGGSATAPGAGEPGACHRCFRENINKINSLCIIRGREVEARGASLYLLATRRAANEVSAGQGTSIHSCSRANQLPRGCRGITVKG